jgi:hypothetical protein
VAVDENGDTEALASRLQEIGQGCVEGPVEPLDTLKGGPDRQPFALDLLGVGNDARNGSEPTHHTCRLGIGKVR